MYSPAYPLYLLKGIGVGVGSVIALYFALTSKWLWYTAALIHLVFTWKRDPNEGLKAIVYTAKYPLLVEPKFWALAMAVFGLCTFIYWQVTGTR